MWKIARTGNLSLHRLQENPKIILDHPSFISYFPKNIPHKKEIYRRLNVTYLADFCFELLIIRFTTF